jgi:hypothetical protein
MANPAKSLAQLPTDSDKMPFCDFEVITNDEAKPLYALFKKGGKCHKVSFEETDIDNEFYCEFQEMGVFFNHNGDSGKVMCQNLKDWSSYTPNKTITIKTQSSLDEAKAKRMAELEKNLRSAFGETDRSVFP